MISVELASTIKPVEFRIYQEGKMKLFGKAAEFWSKNKKILTIVLSALLALCFIGSILIALFIGGEFSPDDSGVKVKGMMQFIKTDYETVYGAGDKFDFKRENTQINLIAKVAGREGIIEIEDMQSYGFKVNGTGDIIHDASSITMTEDVTTISVVSKEFPDIFTDIPVNVVSLDGVEFKDALTLEEQDAELYKDGKLLNWYKDGPDYDPSDVQPDDARRYLASNREKGVEGKLCSGENCFFDFQTNQMEIKYEILCAETTEVELQILICKRPSGGKFGGFYNFTINGREIEAVADLSVPAGPAGQYFEPYTLETVTVTLRRGANVLSFTNYSNPVNFDAIKLTASSGVLGVRA